MSAPSRCAPTTPAAGPDSMMQTGFSAASPAGRTPPFDCMMVSGVVTPARRIRASRELRYVSTTGRT